MNPDFLQSILTLFGLAMSQGEMDSETRGRNREFDEMMASPFVTDTLNVLAGGEPGMLLRVPLPDAQGAAHPLGDLVLINQSNPSISALVHEMGHLFDFRDISPELLGAVGSRFDETIPNTYESQSPEEHFAVAWGTALDVIRNSGVEDFPGKLEAADSLTPGTKEVALYMLSTPLFNEHPLSGMQ